MGITKEGDAEFRTCAFLSEVWTLQFLFFFFLTSLYLSEV
jgi:hypothetical protein